ncbi:MAG: hypothetical protein KIT33_03850 [Candidatus Kapabacteria bacterium]|nr:hypothetical protein [Ignavibacteriota bacterium]MCW5884087.1 hypothetical protein [Candidatus Kapabacteria bacterium]
MKIGIIQLGRIGDMVLMTPLFSEIKKLFPESEITVFAGPSNNSIIQNNPNISKIFTVRKSPVGVAQLLLKLLSTKFDYWIDPKDHFSKESRIIAKFAKANQKIGFNHPDKIRVFNIDLPQSNENLHHTLITLNSISCFGYVLPDTIPRPELHTNESSDGFVEKFLAENHVYDNFAVLNISGSHERKMWDNSSWVEFLNLSGISVPIVLCFAPAEKMRAEELCRQFEKLIIFNSRDINDIVSIVSRCKYLLSPDTAIVHIAAAFNKPVFVLYSGMDNFYVKFHPLSEKYITVRAKKGDSGIKSISPREAIQKFNKFLEII